MVRVLRTVAGPESELHDSKRVSTEDGRGLYTFTDCEMSICRSAQLASYTGVAKIPIATQRVWCVVAIATFIAIDVDFISL